MDCVETELLKHQVNLLSNNVIQLKNIIKNIDTESEYEVIRNKMKYLASRIVDLTTQISEKDAMIHELRDVISKLKESEMKLKDEVDLYKSIYKDGQIMPRCVEASLIKEKLGKIDSMVYRIVEYCSKRKGFKFINNKLKSISKLLQSDTTFENRSYENESDVFAKLEQLLNIWKNQKLLATVDDEEDYTAVQLKRRNLNSHVIRRTKDKLIHILGEKDGLTNSSPINRVYSDQNGVSDNAASLFTVTNEPIVENNSHSCGNTADDENINDFINSLFSINGGNEMPNDTDVAIGGSNIDEGVTYNDLVQFGNGIFSSNCELALLSANEQNQNQFNASVSDVCEGSNVNDQPKYEICGYIAMEPLPEYFEEATEDNINSFISTKSQKENLKSLKKEEVVYNVVCNVVDGNLENAICVYTSDQVNSSRIGEINDINTSNVNEVGTAVADKSQEIVTKDAFAKNHSSNCIEEGEEEKCNENLASTTLNEQIKPKYECPEEEIEYEIVDDVTDKSESEINDCIIVFDEEADGTSITDELSEENLHVTETKHDGNDENYGNWTNCSAMSITCERNSKQLHTNAANISIGEDVIISDDAEYKRHDKSEDKLDNKNNFETVFTIEYQKERHKNAAKELPYSSACNNVNSEGNANGSSLHNDDVDGSVNDKCAKVQTDIETSDDDRIDGTIIKRLAEDRPFSNYDEGKEKIGCKENHSDNAELKEQKLEQDFREEEVEYDIVYGTTVDNLQSEVNEYVVICDEVDELSNSNELNGKTSCPVATDKGDNVTSQSGSKHNSKNHCAIPLVLEHNSGQPHKIVPNISISEGVIISDDTEYKKQDKSKDYCMNELNNKNYFENVFTMQYQKEKHENATKELPYSISCNNVNSEGNAKGPVRVHDVDGSVNDESAKVKNHIETSDVDKIGGTIIRPLTEDRPISNHDEGKEKIERKENHNVEVNEQRLKQDFGEEEEEVEYDIVYGTIVDSPESDVNQYIVICDEDDDLSNSDELKTYPIEVLTDKGDDKKNETSQSSLKHNSTNHCAMPLVLEHNSGQPYKIAPYISISEGAIFSDDTEYKEQDKSKDYCMNELNNKNNFENVFTMDYPKEKHENAAKELPYSSACNNVNSEGNANGSPLHNDDVDGSVNDKCAKVQTDIETSDDDRIDGTIVKPLAEDRPFSNYDEGKEKIGRKGNHSDNVELKEQQPEKGFREEEAAYDIVYGTTVDSPLSDVNQYIVICDEDDDLSNSDELNGKTCPVEVLTDKGNNKNNGTSQSSSKHNSTNHCAMPLVLEHNSGQPHKIVPNIFISEGAIVPDHTEYQEQDKSKDYCMNELDNKNNFENVFIMDYPKEKHENAAKKLPYSSACTNVNCNVNAEGPFRVDNEDGPVNDESAKMQTDIETSDGNVKIVLDVVDDVNDSVNDGSEYIKRLVDIEVTKTDRIAGTIKELSAVDCKEEKECKENCSDNAELKEQEQDFRKEEVEYDIVYEIAVDKPDSEINRYVETCDEEERLPNSGESSGKIRHIGVPANKCFAGDIRTGEYGPGQGSANYFETEKNVHTVEKMPTNEPNELDTEPKEDIEFDNDILSGTPKGELSNFVTNDNKINRDRADDEITSKVALTDSKSMNGKTIFANCTVTKIGVDLETDEGCRNTVVSNEHKNPDSRTDRNVCDIFPNFPVENETNYETVHSGIGDTVNDYNSACDIDCSNGKQEGENKDRVKLAKKHEKIGTVEAFDDSNFNGVTNEIEKCVALDGIKRTEKCLEAEYGANINHCNSLDFRHNERNVYSIFDPEESVNIPANASHDNDLNDNSSRQISTDTDELHITLTTDIASIPANDFQNVEISDFKNIVFSSPKQNEITEVKEAEGLAEYNYNCSYQTTADKTPENSKTGGVAEINNVELASEESEIAKEDRVLNLDEENGSKIVTDDSERWNENSDDKREESDDSDDEFDNSDDSKYNSGRSLVDAFNTNDANNSFVNAAEICGLGRNTDSFVKVNGFSSNHFATIVATKGETCNGKSRVRTSIGTNFSAEQKTSVDSSSNIESDAANTSSVKRDDCNWNIVNPTLCHRHSEESNSSDECAEHYQSDEDVSKETSINEQPFDTEYVEDGKYHYPLKNVDIDDQQESDDNDEVPANVDIECYPGPPISFNSGVTDDEFVNAFASGVKRNIADSDRDAGLSNTILSGGKINVCDYSIQNSGKCSTEKRAFANSNNIERDADKTVCLNGNSLNLNVAVTVKSHSEKYEKHSDCQSGENVLEEVSTDKEFFSYEQSVNDECSDPTSGKSTNGIRKCNGRQEPLRPDKITISSLGNDNSIPDVHDENSSTENNFYIIGNKSDDLNDTGVSSKIHSDGGNKTSITDDSKNIASNQFADELFGTAVLNPITELEYNQKAEEIIVERSVSEKKLHNEFNGKCTERIIDDEMSVDNAEQQSSASTALTTDKLSTRMVNSHVVNYRKRVVDLAEAPNEQLASRIPALTDAHVTMNNGLCLNESDSSSMHRIINVKEDKTTSPSEDDDYITVKLNKKQLNNHSVEQIHNTLIHLLAESRHLSSSSSIINSLEGIHTNTVKSTIDIMKECDILKSLFSANTNDQMELQKALNVSNDNGNIDIEEESHGDVINSDHLIEHNSKLVIKKRNNEYAGSIAFEQNPKRPCTSARDTFSRGDTVDCDDAEYERHNVSKNYGQKTLGNKNNFEKIEKHENAAKQLPYAQTDVNCEDSNTNASLERVDDVNDSVNDESMKGHTKIVTPDTVKISARLGKLSGRTRNVEVSTDKGDDGDSETSESDEEHNPSNYYSEIEKTLYNTSTGELNELNEKRNGDIKLVNNISDGSSEHEAGSNSRITIIHDDESEADNGVIIGEIGCSAEQEITPENCEEANGNCRALNNSNKQDEDELNFTSIIFDPKETRQRCSVELVKENSNTSERDSSAGPASNASSFNQLSDFDDDFENDCSSSYETDTDHCDSPNDSHDEENLNSIFDPEGNKLVIDENVDILEKGNPFSLTSHVHVLNDNSSQQIFTDTDELHLSLTTDIASIPANDFENVEISDFKNIVFSSLKQNEITEFKEAEGLAECNYNCSYQTTADKTPENSKTGGVAEINNVELASEESEIAKEDRVLNLDEENGSKIVTDDSERSNENSDDEREESDDSDDEFDNSDDSKYNSGRSLVDAFNTNDANNSFVNATEICDLERNTDSFVKVNGFSSNHFATIVATKGETCNGKSRVRTSIGTNFSAEQKTSVDSSSNIESDAANTSSVKRDDCNWNIVNPTLCHRHSEESNSSDECAEHYQSDEDVSKETSINEQPFDTEHVEDGKYHYPLKNTRTTEFGINDARDPFRRNKRTISSPDKKNNISIHSVDDENSDVEDRLCIIGNESDDSNDSGASSKNHSAAGNGTSVANKSKNIASLLELINQFAHELFSTAVLNAITELEYNQRAEELIAVRSASERKLHDKFDEITKPITDDEVSVDGVEEQLLASNALTTHKLPPSVVNSRFTKCRKSVADLVEKPNRGQCLTSRIPALTDGHVVTMNDGLYLNENDWSSMHRINSKEDKAASLSEDELVSVSLKRKNPDKMNEIIENLFNDDEISDPVPVKKRKFDNEKDDSFVSDLSMSDSEASNDDVKCAYEPTEVTIASALEPNIEDYRSDVTENERIMADNLPNEFNERYNLPIVNEIPRNSLEEEDFLNIDRILRDHIRDLKRSYGSHEKYGLNFRRTMLPLTLSVTEQSFGCTKEKPCDKQLTNNPASTNGGDIFEFNLKQLNTFDKCRLNIADGNFRSNNFKEMLPTAYGMRCYLFQVPKLGSDYITEMKAKLAELNNLRAKSDFEVPPNSFFKKTV